MTVGNLSLRIIWKVRLFIMKKHSDMRHRGRKGEGFKPRGTGDWWRQSQQAGPSRTFFTLWTLKKRKPSSPSRPWYSRFLYNVTILIIQILLTIQIFIWRQTNVMTWLCILSYLFFYFWHVGEAILHMESVCVHTVSPYQSLWPAPVVI